MKKINFNETKFSKFLKGKGFYLALCCCVAVVGVAGYVTYKQTAEKLQNQLNLDNKSSYTDDSQNVEVDINKDNQPIVTEAAETEAPVTKPVETEAAAIAETQPFIMPVEGEIINEFSNGNLVKSTTLNCWKTHSAIDIKGNLGDQVKSMTSGKVTDVYEDPMWGVCVVIDHKNGIEGHYYNLNKTIPVKVGEKVSAGTIIGAIGDTAEAEIADVSHLHFGVKKNNEWINPCELIK